MASVLIIYHTTDGQTGHISGVVRDILEANAHSVTLLPLSEADDIDPTKFDVVVIGASIRYGHHHQDVYRFIERHAAALAHVRSAFFSVNVVARKPGRNRPDTNPYVKKFLRQIPWQPELVGVFAGKIDYRHYRFWDRQMIRLIMYITKGPTDPNACVEFTDWDDVKAFAAHLEGLNT